MQRNFTPTLTLALRGMEFWISAAKRLSQVASRLAAQHLGLDADDDYPRRFERLAEELRLDFGVDCSGLYGTDLAQMPAELSALFVARLEQQVFTLGLSKGGERRFPAEWPGCSGCKCAASCGLPTLPDCGTRWPLSC